ncbi:MAG: 5'-methylthioadenosine/adenosylhomocysteine nucleosidase [Phycisphaerales bacterium]
MLAILTAMPQELEHLAGLVENRVSVPVAGSEVTRGTLWGQDVLLAFSRWGKVAAAISASAVLATHRPSRVLFSGIAGSLRDDLAVGDIVVARRLYQHDLDASPFFPPTHVPLLNLSALPTDDASSKELHAAAEVFLAEDFEGALGSFADRLNPPRRSVHADVATGDVVVASRDLKTRVRRVVPTAACVEMEGAAVAQACHAFGVPFVCMRVISDTADERVHQEDVMTMAAIAGKYTAGVLKRWMLG